VPICLTRTATELADAAVPDTTLPGTALPDTELPSTAPPDAGLAPSLPAATPPPSALAPSVAATSPTPGDRDAATPTTAGGTPPPAATPAATPSTAASMDSSAAAPPAPALSAAAPPTAPALFAPPPTPASPTAPPDPEALARAYRRTGAAPSIERPTESLFPFGHLRPVLRCAPLRACAVELETGEVVLATSLGDAERWLLQAAASGPGARTPLLVVKPVACDLSTNLVISTDRRIYEIALDSPPCRNADSGDAGYNPHLQYTGVARFYYPDDLVRRWAAQEDLARADADRQTQGRTPLAPSARLAHLNFDYSWDRSRRWPWVPAQIFDDGEHTYIALPPAAHLAEMPLLFAVTQGGQLALLNYHLDGQTLVADRVLDHAVLVVGAAKPRDQQRLDILNRSFPGNAPRR
jgi:P-type conjugative transfer protein TrbG